MRREILWVLAPGTSDDKQPHAESAEFRGGRGKSFVQPLLVFRSGRDFKYPGPSDDKQPHAEDAEKALFNRSCFPIPAAVFDFSDC